MTGLKHQDLCPEDKLHQILKKACRQLRSRSRVPKAIGLWMTDCAAHTLHIYEAIPTENLGVRTELIRAQYAAAGITLLQPSERTLSWASLQDIAHQSAHCNFAAAAWAVRSVAWTLRDAKTASNCASASLNAVKIAFPDLASAETAWQTKRLKERLENPALCSVQPGIRYHS